MAGDVRYVCDISFEVGEAALNRGLSGLSGQSDKLAGAWNRLGKEMFDAGRGIANAFTSAVERVGALTFSAAKIGAGGLFAGAVYGVGVLNNELEKTTVSIGAVLNAQGQASGMKDGVAKAGDIVAQMRDDAKNLPGEFSDLLGIFQSGVGAAGNAGINAVQFEELAANAMAAGKALSVPIDQAGRELAMLLDGRAGAHNVFGTRLGIRAHGFNEKGPEDRVRIITEALGRFEPAIKTFGTTFDAMWSTAVDNVKVFGQQATAPLFDRAKEALGDINRFFEENKGTVSTWAHRIGDALSNAFQTGRRFIEEWGPVVATFAENAYNRISQIWTSVAPTIQSIGESIKSFLLDEGALDKILKVVELYGMVKAGGAASGVLGAMAGMGDAAGAGGAGGLLAGAIGTAGTLAITVGAVTIAAQVAQLLGGNAGKQYDMFEGDSIWATIGNLFVRKSQSAVDEERGRSMQLDRLVKQFGELDMAGASYQSRMESLISSGDLLGASMLSAAAAANSAASALGALGAPSGPGGMSQSEFTADVHSYIGLAASSGLAAQMASEAVAKTPKAKGGGGGGGGGTMKVEITISSNQAPGQIARMVKDELLNLRRHPRSSPFAPNFSAVARR